MAFPDQVLLVTHSDHGVREAQVLTRGIRASAWSAGNRNLTGEGRRMKCGFPENSRQTMQLLSISLSHAMSEIYLYEKFPCGLSEIPVELGVLRFSLLNPENMVLWGRHPTQKDKHRMVPLLGNAQNRQICTRGSRWVVARAGGQEGVAA